MVRIKNYLGILLGILISIVILAHGASAESTLDKYYDDFIEGEEKTVSLAVLETLSFTYYDKNYSMRVLGAYSDSATIRIEKKGFDVFLDQTSAFNIDDNMDYDMHITLTSVDGENCIFKLKLNKKPELEELKKKIEENKENNEENKTEETSSSSSSSSQTEDDKKTSSSTKDTSSSSTTSSTSTRTSSSRKSSTDNLITGANTVNIDIDISITERAVGYLFVLVIIVGGLIIYKAQKNREFINSVLRAKTGRRIKVPVSALERFNKKMGIRLKKIFKSIRIKLGEVIAGKRFEKDGGPKNSGYKA